MPTRKFTLVACAVFGIAVTGSADAQEIEVTADGCAELARAVYDEVASAAADARRSGPWVIGPRFRPVSTCASATRTVSRAFRLAMASTGGDVRFGREPMDPGDFCLSGFLPQCYPQRYPSIDGGSAPQAVIVHSAWMAVAQTVMRSMANPYSSNEIRFDPDELRLQLGLALRTIDRTR